jgi:hypothetical protein
VSDSEASALPGLMARGVPLPTLDGGTHTLRLNMRVLGEAELEFGTIKAAAEVIDRFSQATMVDGFDSPVLADVRRLYRCMTGGGDLYDVAVDHASLLVAMSVAWTQGWSPKLPDDLAGDEGKATAASTGAAPTT